MLHIIKGGDLSCQRTYWPSYQKRSANLPDYDRSKLAQWARELGFVRDTLEKVLRLSDVLVLDF